MKYIDGVPSDIALDQIYTAQPVADWCYAIFCEHCDPSQFLMFEPSAGTGSFFKLLRPGSRGCDREPKYPGVEKKDFLTITIESDLPIAFIGNPPFGRNSNMAIRFVNYAARQGRFVGFILPRTFRKAWVQDRLNPYLHLIRDELVPDDAFLFRGRPHNVPAVFQIWERRSEKRKRPDRATTHPDFEFLKTSKGANFVIRRVGVRAGRIDDNISKNPSTHYFLRSKVETRRDLYAVMWQLDFRSASENVAGPPSLSMAEIVELYDDFVVREDLSGMPPGYSCSAVYGSRCGVLCS